jgi:hypothetical protein
MFNQRHFHWTPLFSLSWLLKGAREEKLWLQVVLLAAPTHYCHPSAPKQTARPKGARPFKMRGSRRRWGWIRVVCTRIRSIPRPPIRPSDLGILRAAFRPSELFRVDFELIKIAHAVGSGIAVFVRESALMLSRVQCDGAWPGPRANTLAYARPPSACHFHCNPVKLFARQSNESGLGSRLRLLQLCAQRVFAYAALQCLQCKLQFP